MWAGQGQGACRGGGCAHRRQTALSRQTGSLAAEGIRSQGSGGSPWESGRGRSGGGVLGGRRFPRKKRFLVDVEEM